MNFNKAKNYRFTHLSLVYVTEITILVGENDEEYHTDELPSLIKPSVGKCKIIQKRFFFLINELAEFSVRYISIYHNTF